MNKKIKYDKMHVIEYKEERIEYWKQRYRRNKEIRKCIDDGILAENINEIYLKEVNGKYVGVSNIWINYLSTIEIKLGFVDGDDMYNLTSTYRYSIFFTDFHLIIFQGVQYDWDYKNNAKIFHKPKDVIIIPLEEVKEFKVVFSRNSNGFTNPTFTTKKKSPVAGAVVGGIIAGPTGAVVGAVANQGEKKVISSPGGVWNYDYYELVIKIGDTTIKMDEVLKIDKVNGKGSKINLGLNNYLLGKRSSNEPIYNGKIEENITNRGNYLIERSKKNLINEEKRKIVESYIESSTEEYGKVKTQNSILGMVGIGFFILLSVGLAYVFSKC